MRITAIEKQERRQRVNVFLDGAYGFSLSIAVLAEHGLHTDMEVSSAQVATLQEADGRYLAYQAALRLLARRPRSEKELRQRLQRRGITPALIDETVEKLTTQGYVNDAEFARFWVESRETASPRGKRLLTWELRGKGVATETATAATEEVSDEEAAYRAAVKRVRSMRTSDVQEFRRRLGDFLVRRGFGWDTVRLTTTRLWEELHGERPDLDDDPM